MEGISDGIAVDDCFYCSLLHTQLEACPLCGNSMRYQHAALLSSADIETQVDTLQRDYQLSPSQVLAKVLLSFLHRFGHEAIDYHRGAYPGAIEDMKSLFQSPPK